ncbi:MAG: hypothetical protein ACE5HO_12125 [bacterium]
MSKSWIPTLLLIAVLGAPGHAQSGRFGIGMIVGEPTGISLKHWLGDSRAVDFALAWSFENNNSLTIHGDYLIHNFGLIKVNKGRLPFFYGIGGRIKFDDDERRRNDDSRVGVRVPVGLAYLFDNAVLDLFAELVPILDLAPETDFRLNAAVGIRYFFK